MPTSGFILQPPDSHSFPINADSVHYLVSRGYISMPSISRKEIWDKSKADLFAKAAALIQGTWIVAQSIARGVAHLPLAPLELFTLAFVTSTCMSYYFWWRKPQHVEVPMVLSCRCRVAEILADAGVPSDGYVDTPMDFVEKPQQPWERRPMFADFDLERGVGVDEKRAAVGMGRAPISRVPNDAILCSGLPARLLAALAIPSMIHSAIHLLGWNFQYPSEVERTLWRAATLSLLSVSGVSVGVVRILAVVGYKGQYNMTILWVNRRRESSALALWDCFLIFCTAGLVLVRGYVIVEALMSFRCLPKDVYRDLDWPDFIPHI